MLELDNQWIQFPCPGCGFGNEVRLVQVRLGERLICAGCHRYIRLVDKGASVSSAVNDLRQAHLSFRWGQ